MSIAGRYSLHLWAVGLFVALSVALVTCAQPLPTPTVSAPVTEPSPEAWPTASIVPASSTPPPSPSPPPTATAGPTPAPSPRFPTLESAPAGAPCLAVDESITISSEVLRRPHFEEAIATYLNDGGSIDALADSLASQGTGTEPVLVHLVTRDVTGSGLADILLALTIPYGGGSGEAHVLSFTCQAGRYEEQILFRRAGAGSRAEGLYQGGGAVLEGVGDLNGSGTPDILFSARWPGYREVYLLEWDGEQFASLVSYEDLLGNQRHWIEADDRGVEIVDLDGDGLFEIVVGEPDAVDALTWRWDDGEGFRQEPSPADEDVPEPERAGAWSVLGELGDGFLHLASSPTGSVWALSRESLVRLPGRDAPTFDLPPELREKVAAQTSALSPTVTDLAVSAAGVVWIGTREDGLYRFDGGSWRHDTVADGLPHSGVLRLAIDAQDGLWVLFFDPSDSRSVSGRALFHLDGQTWERLPLGGVDGIPDDLAVAPTGEVWLAVRGDRPGPYLFDGDHWVWAVDGWTAGSRDITVASGPGGLWFGSDAGWVRWMGESWQNPRVTIPAPFSFPVAVDRVGGAWGTVTQFCYWCKIPNYNENGAVYVTEDRSCRFTAADGLGDAPLDPPPDPFTAAPPRPDVVTGIAVGGDGRVCFITQGQITLFSPEDPVCDYAAPENVRIPEP